MPPKRARKKEATASSPAFASPNSEQKSASSSSSSKSFPSLDVQVLYAGLDDDDKRKEKKANDFGIFASLIKDNLRSGQNYCGDLNAGYVYEEVGKQDYLFVVQEPQLLRNSRVKNVLVGYALIKEHQPTAQEQIQLLQLMPVWHITAICTRPGLGTVLMNEIIKLAKRKRVSALTLDAQPNVINYYARFGFHFSPVSTTGRINSACSVPRTLSQSEQDNKIEQFFRSLSDLRFRSNEDAIDENRSPNFVKLLQLLVDNRVVANPQCVGIGREDYRLRKTTDHDHESVNVDTETERKEEAKTVGCSADGYPMVMCLGKTSSWLTPPPLLLYPQAFPQSSLTLPLSLSTSPSPFSSSSLSTSTLPPAFPSLKSSPSPYLFPPAFPSLSLSTSSYEPPSPTFFSPPSPPSLPSPPLSPSWLISPWESGSPHFDPTSQSMESMESIDSMHLVTEEDELRPPSPSLPEWILEQDYPPINFAPLISPVSILSTPFEYPELTNPADFPNSSFDYEDRFDPWMR